MAQPLTPPRLLSFDIFGTVLDWREGLRRDLAARGLALDDALFDRVIDEQGRLEREEPSRRYAEIVEQSLVDVTGLDADYARAIGRNAGHWPPYADAPAALARLGRRIPLVAMTNSDKEHGAAARRSLGVDFAHWIPAEEVGLYKPDPRFWDEAVRRTGVTPGPGWWHVSAYADYDLDIARERGLTTVYVARPHARPPRPGSPPDLTVADLGELADRLTPAS